MDPRRTPSVIINEVPITLGLELRPDVITWPFHELVQRPHAKPEKLPAGTKIIDVFDQGGGSLLILGAPGTGKTTMLLQLTQALLDRAKDAEQQPLPIVFNLSSWVTKQLPLSAWLVEELNTKYDIPRKLAQLYIENDQILPMLDGLDEVATEQCDACVTALNTFKHKHNLVNMVVCSRSADYEALTTKLRLSNALLLQPLTDEQVDSYFKQLGKPLDGVRSALRDDPMLRELTNTPLWVSVMTIAYQGVTQKKLRANSTPEERRTKILADYVEAMFNRNQGRKPYSDQATVKWLTWLAQKMTRHGQTVFLVEQMQPTWLSNRLWQGIYVFCSRILVSLLFYFLWFAPIFGPVDIYNVLAATDMRAVFGDEMPLLIFAYIFSSVWLMLLTLLFALRQGILAGMIVGAIDLIRYNTSLTHKLPAWLQSPLRYIVIVGSVGLFWSFKTFTYFQATSTMAPVRLFTLFANTMVLVVGIPYELIFGSTIVRQSLESDIQTVEQLYSSYRKAARGGLYGLILGSVVALVLSCVVSGLTDGMTTGLEHGIVAGLKRGLESWQVTAPRGVAWLGPVFMGMGAIFAGINSRILDKRSNYNQGMKLSRQNALRAWIWGLLAALICVTLSNVLLSIVRTIQDIHLFGINHDFYKQVYLQTPAFSTPRNLAFSSSLVASLCAIWYGGRDFMQHQSLCFLLRIRRVIPRNYARFLDYCVTRIFLRKVGGGYIFTHHFLLEYFATLHPESR